MKPDNKAIERFWKQVQKSNFCWTWTGEKTGAGYGRLRWNGKKWGDEEERHD